MITIDELKKERKSLIDDKMKVIKRLEDEVDAIKLTFAVEINNINTKIRILDNQMEGIKKRNIANNLRSVKKAIRM